MYKERKFSFEEAEPLSFIFLIIISTGENWSLMLHKDKKERSHYKGSRETIILYPGVSTFPSCRFFGSCSFGTEFVV